MSYTFFKTNFYGCCNAITKEFNNQFTTIYENVKYEFR